MIEMSKYTHVNLKKEECYGCAACYASCSVNAIRMVRDEEGFLYPYVDEEQCIECGRCRSVCPGINFSLNDEKQDYYLVKHKDENVLKSSTSGGLFTAISDYYLNNNGLVFAAHFDSNMKVVHTLINSISDRDKARGSKYVQSELTKHYFMDLKTALKKDIPIVVFGTPCQILATKNYLNKQMNENILFVDVVCNGVGSPMVWDKFVNELNTLYKDNVTNYIFRPKSNGYLSTNEEVEVVNGRKKRIEYVFNKYNTAYYQGLLMRPSCLHCQFSNTKRVADLSIGDFAKANKLFSNFDSSLGASMLIVNTNKGFSAFKLIENVVDYLKVNAEDCDQIRLHEHSKENPNRKRFIMKVKEKGYRNALRTEYSVGQRVCYKVKYILKRGIRFVNKGWKYN